MSSLPPGCVCSSACPEDRGGPSYRWVALRLRLSKGFQPWSLAWMGPVLVKAGVRVQCVQLHGAPTLAGQNLRVTDGLRCLGLGFPTAGGAEHPVSVEGGSETSMGVGGMRGYCGCPPAPGDHVGLGGVCIQWQLI